MLKPMFFNADSEPIRIENLYKNQSIFLILSGPSLLTYDLSKIDQPGIMTFGVNNSPRVFRPNFWTMVDDPTNFMYSIWADPRITKFVPIKKTNHKIFDNTSWQETDIKVKECPGMVYYDRNEHFNHETYLYEDTINWGNHSDYGGGRSVLLVAIRLCHLLGFKNVFLLGADFKMELGQQNYAFTQDRTKSSVNNNNNTYKQLNERFNLLRPIFEKENFFVHNCYQDSGLKSFPFISFDDAVETCLKDFPNTLIERTDGMYERRSKTEKERKAIKAELDKKRLKLDECKRLREEYAENDAEVIKKLDEDIAVARSEFRVTEKQKNKIWGIKKDKK